MDRQPARFVITTDKGERCEVSKSFVHVERIRALAVGDWQIGNARRAASTESLPGCGASTLRGVVSKRSQRHRDTNWSRLDDGHWPRRSTGATSHRLFVLGRGGQLVVCRETLDVLECSRAATIGASNAHARPKRNDLECAICRPIRKERRRVPRRPVGGLPVVIGAQQTPEQASAHEALHFASNPVVATAPAFRLVGPCRGTDKRQESI